MTRRIPSLPTMAFIFGLVVMAAAIRDCVAWQGNAPIKTRQSQTKRPSLHMSSASSDSMLEGVGDFESWFSSVEGAKSNPYIKHTTFGELRGLGTLDKSIGSTDSGSWMTIPRSITLQSDFSQSDWDAKLADSLWKEVEKGSSSSVRGYVSLLTKSWTTKDLPATPPLPASDALRHWSDEEKSVLSTHPKGQALLDLQKRQEQAWKSKYEALEGSSMTWKQFEWAMEAVHSRAFCGDFGIGGGGLPAAVQLGTPALSAVACYTYFAILHGQNDAILIALAALGTLPTLINLIRESPPVAVLLPLIDSANHLEEADSSIEYSPLTDSFDLKGGKGCLLEEDNGRQQQLYISYGKKSDQELLLNYGFLKGTSYEVGTDATERRRQLAEKFIANQQ